MSMLQLGSTGFGYCELCGSSLKKRSSLDLQQEPCTSDSEPEPLNKKFMVDPMTSFNCYLNPDGVGRTNSFMPLNTHSSANTESTIGTMLPTVPLLPYSSLPKPRLIL
uniref:Uncharacterized protein n=1 Tax=Nelumbo nucifera TaxID=4432 RepID=A0A822YY80_NELNU|nr:TPA_asm: hypothetical protein HUJ06_008263 [Nelumbo nucifera]